MERSRKYWVNFVTGGAAGEGVPSPVVPSPPPPSDTVYTLNEGSWFLKGVREGVT